MIGIESLSERARYHLGKKFTNSDIDFGLEMIRKYGCRTTLLFLIGYITETEQDIQDAVQWWQDHADFKDIAQVNLGTPLGVLKNTPLEKDFEKLNLKWVGPNDTDWANENSDPPTRARWYRILSDTLAECGFHEVHPFDNHYILERIENGRFTETLD